MNDQHFDKIFWFIVFTVAYVLLYITAITFIRIPAENVRYVDISIGFLLGTVLGGGFAYLVGGTPGIHKPTPPSTTAAITTTEGTTATISSNDTIKTDQP